MNLFHFALTGHPLGHSISPQIHARLCGISGVKAEYSLLDIAPEEFESRLPELRALDGFNVTIPHKQRIIPYLDGIDAHAKVFGAVNTVKVENGRLIGYNTDCEGFLRALEAADIKLGGRVLLCGTGGAARMMACEALMRGCTLTVAARSAEKASDCADGLKKEFKGVDVSYAELDGISGDFDLLLNGTPAGMYPDVTGCPVGESIIKSSAAVFDAVYNPAQTVLLRAARKAGAKTQGGLPMLLWQAAAAQTIWTGAEFTEGDIALISGEMAALVENRYGKGERA